MILGKLLLHIDNLKFSSIFYLSFCKKYNFSTIDNTQATLYKWCKESNLWDAPCVFAPVRFHWNFFSRQERNQGKIQLCPTTWSTSLTPVFSSKILIPPKETVKKTFCLCSPFDRAAATIPCGNKKAVLLGFMTLSRATHLLEDNSPLFQENLKVFQEQPPPYFWLPPFLQGTSLYATQRAFQMCSHFQLCTS